MKNKLNHWQIHFHFGKDYRFNTIGWKKFELGILNIKSLPEEGCRLSKRNYKGFLLSFLIWLPIDDIEINS